MATEPTRRLFTIHDYHRMGEAGILTPDDRVELLDGEIVHKDDDRPPALRRGEGTPSDPGPTPRHPSGVGVQDPVTVDELNELEPDISVCAPRSDDYASGHPGPDDVYLLVEVADSSLRIDRLRKIPRYASGGIPEAWLVDLEANTVEVYRRLSATPTCERSASAIAPRCSRSTTSRSRSAT